LNENCPFGALSSVVVFVPRHGANEVKVMTNEMHTTEKPNNERRCLNCAAPLDLVYETVNDMEFGNITMWVWLCPVCGLEHGEGVL